MNYGLYLSASGALANMYRQDVFANNLANVNTVGFKHDLAAITQRRPESQEGGFGADVSQKVLDLLGGGVLAGPQKVSFAQGPIQQTHNPLDVALTRSGEFFAVESAQGGIRLTRDGRFTQDRDGYLATVAGGHRVLGVGDTPIRLNGTGEVTINGRGQVLQNGQVVGQLQVAQVTDQDRLRKVGSNLFAWTSGSDPRLPVQNVVLEPEAVEGSSVDPITAMMNLIDASRAAEGNANLIRFHDTLMDRAVNVLGRIA